jgi:LPXTG-site transpeptidase (sortase) family protein
VQVSINGQQYGPDAWSFYRYNASTQLVHRITPASGPTDGATLLRVPVAGLNASAASAVRADGRAACLFNGTLAVATLGVAGDALHCVTPPSELPGDTMVEVSLNGQQLLPTVTHVLDTSLAYGRGSPERFFYYTSPRLESLVPLSGPGARGVAVFAAHRDTQFAFLKSVKPGDPVTVETANGARTFTVTHAEVVRWDASGIVPNDNGSPRMALVTCWPLDAKSPGPMRYVVWAELSDVRA